ncbi:flagellar hook-associated protein 2 [Duganella sp. SG902]|uniref:flagellar filament capping protein FliD n=1 Tax=Duganella sp. SG902 TaxID=2587016 RepID=UPI00159CFFA0|nr:flagellar filament capping protein FliD [Duganella sp. SG902]NVM79776.1 flagellar hook-associated protein 2 [Duganella sp. SG902]
MAVISSPTYDPKTTAENLANAYVAGTKAILDGRSTRATATASALTTLGSALSAFQSSMSALASGTKSVSANAATFSNTAIATASATSKAVAGTYSFYVEQLATSGQVSYNVNDSVATNAGAMNVMLADGSSFQVDLANADSNMDGVLSAKEVAAAINSAANNGSRVTASTMTVNGQSKLVLTSAKTGAANGVASIDVSGLGDANLQSDLSAQTTLTAAADAIVWVGGQAGTKVQQASNTFNVVDDVSFTITQAQAAGAAPVTMTVAADSSATATNVQSFITAYNTLLGVFDTLTAAGDHSAASSTDSTPKSADAAFHSDAGVLNLRDRLNAALRAATGGISLINFGITAAKDGTLTLDTARLNKTIAANPGTLDSLFGRAGVGVDSGVLGAMNKLTTAWTSSAGGYIASRRDAVTKQQTDIAERQATLQTQFDNAYQRYLAQFTKLQELQSSMTTTSNMFTALFSSDSEN